MTVKKNAVKCTVENGRLSIECSECGHPHDIGSRECVVCICSHINSKGEPERIVLRSGKDTEYFGDAVTILNNLSRIDRIAKAVCGEKNASKKCSICSRSASKLIKGAWSGFPEPDIDRIRSILNEFDPSDDTCGECIMHTYRSIEHIEYALNEIGKNAARSAFSLTEV